MLAIVRVPVAWAPLFAENPTLKGIPQLWTGQEDEKLYKQHCSGPDWHHYRHSVMPSAPAKARRELVSLFMGYHVDYALVCQKLLWYSNLVEEVCQELGIPLVWCENFFDNRLILDRVGLQYCRDNEMYFESVVKPEPLMELSGRTRQKQPDTLTVDELMIKLQIPVPTEPVVVLGQVPHDMALVEYPGLPYYEWLDALFRNNLETYFLFKHHPLAKTEIALQNYANVQVIDENIATLWDAFSLFVSFSSTTIYEGMVRGKKFATGGYHLCSGLTLEIPTAESMKHLGEQLEAFQFRQEAWIRRRTFLCNHYAIHISDPRLWKRITTTSEQFFS
jgi:hypothetical protein